MPAEPYAEDRPTNHPDHAFIRVRWRISWRTAVNILQIGIFATIFKAGEVV